MRRRLRPDDSSAESEHVESDGDDPVEPDTGLTDDEEEEGGGVTKDQAFLSADESHSREHYLRQLEAFDESEYTKEDYKGSTTILLNRIEEQWNQCWTFLGKDRFRDYSTVSVRNLCIFFDWLLGQRRGKGGRKRCGTKLISSLGTYWKVYRLVYERATGEKIDGKMNRSMHKVLRKVAKKHGLGKIGRDKACMYIEDLASVLRTNLTTRIQRYSHARYRIQVHLYLQLAGFTGNRPRAILGLCYRHIQVTLLRDPEGGPHQVLLEFTYEFTKQFLGIKDRNTFPILDIAGDESLLFSPRILLEGMLHKDRAFAAYNLTCPEDLNRLYIPSEKNELPLRLNRELDDVPVFRKAVRTPGGWTISPTEPLPYSTLLPWIRKLGEITGFGQVTRPYSLRYGAGNAFNKNGNVTDSMQNLMMGHANIRTFEKHYLSRRVTVDTQAVIRGIQPQNGLMRAACTMSRTIDLRRPRKLTPGQSASVNDMPTVRSLLDQREKLKHRLGKGATRNPAYKAITRDIARERQNQRYELLQKIKERWEYEQPVRDVENQLAGIEVDIFLEPSNDSLPPPQKELVDAMLAGPGLTQEEETRRYNRAIHAVMVYCGAEEGRVPPARTKRPHDCVAASSKSRDTHGLDPGAIALEAAKVAVYKERRPTICFVCLSDNDLPMEQRLRPFSLSTDLSKHFKRKHLQYIGETELFTCKLCRVHLDGKTHVRRHALDIHGTVS